MIEVVDRVVKSFFSGFVNKYLEELEFEVAMHDSIWITAINKKKRQSFSFRVYEHFHGLLVDVSYSGKKYTVADCFSSDDDSGLQNFGRKACRRMGIECKDG